MAKFEYKLVYGPPTGHFLMPWASQDLKDKIGRGSFEKQLNQLGSDGWELISCSTTSVGSLFFFAAYATAILRREKQ